MTTPEPYEFFHFSSPPLLAFTFHAYSITQNIPFVNQPLVDEIVLFCGKWGQVMPNHRRATRCDQMIIDIIAALAPKEPTLASRLFGIKIKLNLHLIKRI